jgi:hypothetical protein
VYDHSRRAPISTTSELPHAHCVLRNHDEAIKVVFVLGQHEVESCVCCDDWRRRAKTQIDHAGVGLHFDKHQFPEISITGDENPVFSVCDCQHFAIRQAGRMFSRDPYNFMTKALQMEANTCIRTLIQQESHVSTVVGSVVLLLAASACFL